MVDFGQKEIVAALVNERFFSLAVERQNAIINAGLHVFAAYDYRHASTDMIAKKASISKSLLFHYFGNKKDFYLFLYEYAMRYFVGQIKKVQNYSTTDFFDILIEAQLAKIELAKKHPDLFQFVIKGYYENNDEVELGVSEQYALILEESKKRTLGRVNRSKFKEDITLEQAWNIVIWMSEGYVKSLTPEKIKDTQATNKVFLDYLEVLRRHFYREEYL